MFTPFLFEVTFLQITPLRLLMRAENVGFILAGVFNEGRGCKCSEIIKTIIFIKLIILERILIIKDKK